MDDFVQEIQKFSFPCLKTKEKLFAKNYNLKESIETISRKLNLRNVLIKLHSLHAAPTIEEVKIQTNREDKIYKFIEELFFELPGIVQFESIKIFPTDKKDLMAIIQFKVSIPEECPNLITLNPSDRTNAATSIRLFGKAKTHKLFCTIHNSKAYIDDGWFQVGARTDDFELKDVGPNYIEVQDDTGRKIRVKLGTTW
jgi:hypothetical protein